MWTSEHSIETTAAPEAVWGLWSDVPRWPEWNADLERATLSGPFAARSTITMYHHRAGGRHAGAADRPGDQRRLSPGPGGARRARRTLMLHPSESPGFLLWHATLRWQRGISQALAPLDLTHVQFVLLACAWWLNQQGQHPSQIALASFAGTDVKMTSQVLRSLERKGLVEREVDRADTRALRLRVTRRGARLAPRAIAVVQQVDAEFFDEVPRAAALRLLRQLARLPEAEAANQ